MPIPMSGPDKKRLARRLLAWYDRNRRDLPWRGSPDPYRVWVSEIMLQQTQVDTVIPYYRRFLERFPTVRSLAGAALDDVLKAWENLGYYARARNLHAAAREIEKKFDGRLPESREKLLSLPGIGPYTAGALLSIAFDRPEPCVDGNIRRVLSRLFALQTPLREAATLGRIGKIAAALVPARRPGHYNQALMDLGAAVCLPRKPACGLCPVAEICGARSKNLQDRIPVTPKGPPVPHRDAAAGIVLDEGRVLVVRRPERGLLGGLWKFPGGERAGEESLQAALRRATLEETGLPVRVGKKLFTVDHGYSHFRVTFHVFRCAPVEGKPGTSGRGQSIWASPEEIGRLALSRADREIARNASIMDRKTPRKDGKGEGGPRGHRRRK